MKTDFTDAINKILLNSNKNEMVIDNEQIRKNLEKKGFFSVDPYQMKKYMYDNSEFLPINDTLMGFSPGSGGIVVFSKHEFYITDKGVGFRKFNIEKLKDLKIKQTGFTTESVFLNGEIVGEFNRNSIDNWNNIVSNITPFFDSLLESQKVEEEKRLEEEQNRLEEEQRLEEEKRLKELQVSQTNVLSELDKDGNGQVDIIEGDDFNKLLKKHQNSIVEVDRKYVQQFVKVSSYIKTKKSNIQSIFNSIKETPNQRVLNEYVEILKDEIHTYNLVLFNSLNMVVSLIEDDMITFYEIHEMFDTLNMFDSKHEKDVSQKLTNIGVGLKHLMIEIRKMSDQISESIGELSYVTEESNKQLTNQLSEIDSTMKVGNLISTINTYQNYKTNRRLNS